MDAPPTLLLTLPEGEAAPFLQRRVEILAGRLRTRLGARCRVAVGDPLVRPGRWEQTITVRKGTQTGADVDVKWTGGKTAALAATHGSQLATALLLFVVLPLAAFSAWLGYAHVLPLSFLPGWRSAAAIGGVIGVLGGSALSWLIQSLVWRAQCTENERLLASVGTALRELCEDSAVDG